MIMGFAVGSLVGMGIGGASGYFQGSKKHLIRGLIFGLIFGFLGGRLGIMLGSKIFDMVLGGADQMSSNPISIIVARAAGWSIFGGFLGLAEGAVGMNIRRAVQGLVGGLIGGFAAGIVFDIVGNTVGIAVALGGNPGQVNEVGAIPRAIGLTTVGAGIGLFIGIIEAVSKVAWVRLVLGRNEGREWQLDGAQTNLGRDERAHIPLFGDQNVAPLHAMILKNGRSYILQDNQSPIGTGLNGARITQANLNHGDTIMVGSHQLQFFLRGGQPVSRPVDGRVMVPVSHPSTAPMQPGMPSNPTVMQQPVPMAQTQAVAPVGFSLFATSGPLTGQRFPVMGAMEVGRENPSIPLSTDSGVSRRHASLLPTPGGLQVTDLGSTNGTFVNGVKVQSSLVQKGEILQIGGSTFRIE
jgi:pSer/pThr/pTyr-binding forkhead associated (FHA) protein